MGDNDEKESGRMVRIQLPLEELPIHSDEEMITKYLPCGGDGDGIVWIELGCGDAETTRKLATKFPHIRIIALEVDKIQHEKNVQAKQENRFPPNIDFDSGGMESIPLSIPDASVDAVIMLKSLHHVPTESFTKGFGQVARVLKPGGKLYISEPVFAGAFNDIISLFHNESNARTEAFEALQRQVSEGTHFKLECELHFHSEIKFPNGFIDFENKLLNATHTHFHITPEIMEEVKERFAKHVNPQTGEARFLFPLRVDLLIKK